MYVESRRIVLMILFAKRKRDTDVESKHGYQVEKGEVG